METNWWQKRVPSTAWKRFHLSLNFFWRNILSDEQSRLEKSINFLDVFSEMHGGAFPSIYVINLNNKSALQTRFTCILHIVVFCSSSNISSTAPLVNNSPRPLATHCSRYGVMVLSVNLLIGAPKDHQIWVELFTKVPNVLNSRKTSY